MPTISVFIRKGDLGKWRGLEHKSEWLHQQLALTTPAEVHEENFRSIEVPKKLVDQPELDPLARFRKGNCKVHGIPLTMEGKCLQKGCKYS